jgi:signal transduction histidine kinase
LQSAEQVTLATVPLAYLLGLFRARMARGGVSELVVELGRAPEQGKLRDALARALRDPTLELGYWIPESGEYVDVDGRAVSADPPARRAVTILERRGEKVAALVHDAALRENPALLDAVSSAGGLALENERLLADLRSQLEQTRESRARIVGAGDAERRRLERNLHDGAQQRLVAVSLQMGRAACKIEDDPEGAAALLETTRGELGLALEELRELARGLHPAVLTERGLLLALKSLAARAPIPVRVATDLSASLSAPLEAAVYYVVAEALTNTAKYANAKTVSVELTCENGRVNVRVRDDGVGGADPRAGSGLRGLKDRIEAFDGSLTVTSPRNGGTLIDVDLPLQVLDGEAA